MFGRATIRLGIGPRSSFIKCPLTTVILASVLQTRMWANAQPDGRPAEHRWRPLLNAATFG